MIDETLTAIFAISIITFLPWTLIAVLPARRRSKGKTVPLTVVIPAHNEESCIESTVRSVLAAEYPSDVEVLVVDDGSTDRTRERVVSLAASDPRVRLIGTDHVGKALAVNKGVGESANEIVVMLDADSDLAPDALSLIVEPFSDGRVGAVSGIISVKVNANPLTWYQEFEYILSSMWRYIFNRLGCTYVLPGFAAFRKEALQSVGCFATDTLSEDCDIGLKMHKGGWRLVMSEATMYTTVPQTLQGVARQRIRWGRGAIQVLRKHRDMILNPRYGLIGLYGMPNQIYFFVQGFIILPITFYQIFNGYLQYFAAYGNYMSLDVVKYFFGWISAWGTIEFVRNTVSGVWPMSPSFPYFLASYVLIQGYDVIAAIRMTGLRPRLLIVPPVLFFFFPYYLFTLTFFIYPLLLELNPLRRRDSHVNIWEKVR